MSDDQIQRDLRSALNAIKATEKERLTEMFDTIDAEGRARIEMMAPVVEAVRVLETDFADDPEIEISSGPIPAAVRLNIKSSTGSASYTLSTDRQNQSFTVESREYFTFDPHNFENKKAYENADDALRVLVEAIGKYVASREVIRGRANKT